MVSTARYAPAVTPATVRERVPGVSTSTIHAHRVAATVVHELGHCFGLDHCERYNCAMRGTDTLAEDLEGHFDVCPLDAHKLVLSYGVDLPARAAAMRDWLESEGGPLRKMDCQWLTERMRHTDSGCSSKHKPTKGTKRGRA